MILSSAIAALLWLSSSATTNAATIGKRDLVVPAEINGWISQGCYIDVGRTLTGAGYDNNTGMTDESCISYCEKLGYIYAGTEYAEECYCGDSLASGSGPAPASDCSTPCSGNATEACGGGNRLNLYWSGTTGPSTNSGPGLWSFSGCYTEGTTGRALTVGATVTGGSTNMTVANCVSECQVLGYDLAGLEYSGECYCDNSISNGATLAPDGLTGCSMLCNGNFSEFCGGSNRLDVYDFNKTVTLPAWNTTAVSSTTTSVTSTSNSIVVTTSSSSVVSSLSSAASTSSSSSSSTKAASSSSVASSSSTVSSSISSSSTTTPQAPAATSTGPSLGPYIYYGCQTEGTNVRALSGAASASDTMTLEMCEASCSGYTYWGTEYGRECYCGNSFGAGSIAAAAADCSFPCAGDANETCGAGNRLSVYVLNGTVTSTTSSIASTSATGTGTSSASASVTSSSAATGFPTGWSYYGCYVDGLTGRILQNQLADNEENTLQVCVAACAAAGYTIAGAEYGVQCFCGDAIYNGGVLATNQADCSVACPGNTAEDCGAGNRMSLYSLGTPEAYQAPAAQTSGLLTGWTYGGCLQDNIASNEDPNEILSTFPYKVWDNATSNTPELCIARCQEFGYNAAGLEYGSQCFCGDVENIYVASAPSTSTDPDDTQYYTRSSVPEFYDASECNSACTGAAQYLCGAGNRLTYYYYNATEPLYVWGNPTGTAAGEYSLLIGGVVVPLIVSQTVNGKVTFVEKFGTGEPNGTGAYELDLSQIDNFSAAWRTMTGLQTDVFCAAGLTLPDKAGRQLTAGGWAGESNFGIRLYWPDGSAGVEGTNEWIEDPGVLQLQVPRWYPSALIMANGSILIVGGEVGQNAAEQPTLEILPATGVPDASTTSGYSNTTVYLDFLDRTAPFNLYPFIVVMKTGIFIAYYNEARILDEVTFETIKTLPNMPAAVNDPTGGRTYQLEGSMVILPQYAPYTDPVGVLICGGSTSGGGYPIDNCVSTQPEAAEPTWTIERMPSRRVMPCMAGLPDGTYVILNGAEHGYAGFGLAGSPNLNAVIYDPSKPVNQRMSIMANTTVARLYHSEATVLLDGRVLVSGSDPTGDYASPAGSFPEEYRVEVFSPPYLLTGATRPNFTLSSTDWAYGESVTFTVTTGTASTVSLLGSVVSTHGNAMGQRTIFPEFSCAGTTCTVVAPPDAHTSPPGWFMFFVLENGIPSVGQFVRIGGDPAGLGNWPDLPPFEGSLPGV
ncbi:hypothetical protein BDZ45DRAFT_688777 [Acephala macrosclerotiorum]|nr:hypothetical protein BDZ45DRAFT_688777 [Acephala macrosclerotiorum]